MTQTYPSSAVLTDTAIYRLPSPTSQRVNIRDGKLSQLVLTLGPKSRTWWLHATVHRKTRRVHLGRFPIVGTEDARKGALEALQALYAGKAPDAKREQGLTLQDVLDRYLTSRKLQPSSIKGCRSVVEKHAAGFLAHPIANMSADALASRYRSVAAHSISQANVLMRNLSALTRYAAVAYGTGDAALVTKARTLLGGLEALPARENTIPEALQGKWFAEVHRLREPVRRLMLALALTGCRRDELRLAPAAGWDGATRAVIIDTTKSGKPHSLPAGPHLAHLLDGSTGGGGRLFDVEAHDVRAAYERVGAAIGHPFTAHDLRRTFATTATRLGIEEVMVKRLLNHAPTGVTQTHYIKLGLEDLRKPMKAIESRMLTLWGIDIRAG